MLYLFGSFLFRLTLGAVGFVFATISTPEEFGDFSSALTINSVIVTFCVVGVSEYLLLTGHSLKWEAMYRGALRIAVISFVAVLYTYYFFGEAFLLYVGAWLLAYRLATNLYSVYLMKLKRLNLLGAILITQTLFCASIFCFAILYEAALIPTLKLLFAGATGINIIALLIFKFEGAVIGDGLYIETIKKCWPYTLSPVLAYFYLTFNIVVIKYLIGSLEAGAYSLALTFSLLVFAGLDIGAKLFFDKSATDNSDLKPLFHVFCLYSGLGYALFLFVNMEALVGLFDEGYLQLRTTLYVMLPVVLLHSYIYYFSYCLLVNGRVKERNKAQLSAACFSIGINTTLIVCMGYSGALVGLLASEAFLFYRYFKLVRFESTSSSSDMIVIVGSMLPLAFVAVLDSTFRLEQATALAGSLVALVISLFITRRYVMNFYRVILNP